MIDSSNRTFNLPPGNSQNFENMTRLQPDLLAYLIEGPKTVLMAGDQTSGLLKDMWDSHSEWVDRTCHFLWIRSPALQFTLKGARQRYQQFFDLLASRPGTPMVPTSDIELIWLTHQSSPLIFSRFSRTFAGRVVKLNVVPKARLNQQQSIATEKAFQARFGMELQRCLCWDCQNLQRLAEDGSFGDKDLEQLIEQAVRDVAYHRAVECARRQRNKLIPRF